MTRYHEFTAHSLRRLHTQRVIRRAHIPAIAVLLIFMFATGASAASTSTKKQALFEDGRSPHEVRTKLKKSNGTNESGASMTSQSVRIQAVSSNPNLIQNPDFETAGTNGLPANWSKGGYGTNTRVFSYPATGAAGTKGAKVTVSNYSGGDAKWYFAPVQVSAGTYTYADQYSSTVPSIVTVQFQNTSGAFTYKDIATLPASSAFKSMSADFVVPSGTTNVTVFHLIKGNGALTIDNVSLMKKSGSSGVFSTGAVTLRFDDGWLSQYQHALPKLKGSGLKGTFYIVTHQLSDNGFTGYMSKAQVQELFASGMEIGSHTRTHRDLTTLSSADQQTEIQGARQDLLGWNVGPINSFAYPFGAYNSSILQIVKNAGYSSAAATIDGNVTPNSDPYQLERQGLVKTTTLAQVKAWVDDAIAKKQWLILTFHEVNTTCGTYCVSPTLFNQIVDYVKSKNVPVVTVSQGMESLQ